MAVACALPAFAQVTGRVSGSVNDASGAAVPGAAVNLYLAGGAKPVLSTKTTHEGLFTFTAVRPEFYDLAVEAAGFVKYTLRGVKVDPARETAVTAIKLELPAVVQSVEVTGSVETVQTGNAEISATVSTEQVRRLPVLDRDPLALIQTQAGVTYNGRSDTVINGQRTSYANVTFDGVNIQDNYIRDNALDYVPNMLLLDEVAEMTVSTSNTNASVGGGSAQVTFVSRAGTNDFHGAGYWYNRNSKFAANGWFENRDGVARPFLNQNQLGGSIGGPIRKDKLFFYTNYEVYRQRHQEAVQRTILTADARQGIFTYLDRNGNAQKVNLLRSIGIDPTMQGLIAGIPGPEKINNFDSGDSTPDRLRNTAGYSFLQRDNRTRDNWLGRGDYHLSTQHVFTGSFMWNRDNMDRYDYDNSFDPVPRVSNINHSNLLSTAWRWTPGPTLTNELRFGFNLAPGEFPTTQQFGSAIIDGMIFSNPVSTSQPQGRYTNTWVLADNATWIRGGHTLQYGFQWQRITAESFDSWGIVPTYYLGIGEGNEGVDSRMLPGIRSQDLTAADDFLATMAGYITEYDQFFNVTSRDSGYVPGARFLRHYNLPEYAFYVQDKWKVLPRVAVTLGLRYTLYGIAEERDALQLQPVIRDNDPVRTLLSNSTLDYAGSAAGRPLYRRDRNNFAPNIGLAWDVFGNGRTAFRAGYSISHVNDQALLAGNGIAELNAGLLGESYDSGLEAMIRTGLPRIPTPDFKVPRTFADNYDEDPSTAFGLVNPNLRTPYVQQWTLGLQQEIKGSIVEVRYVGNHSVGGLRAFDYNQVIIRENGFLEDFNRARRNGFLALASTGVFNPAYNSSIAGSQPLTVFPRLSRNALTSNTYRNLIESGQVGELAASYQINGANGPVDFFPNPVALGADYLTNYSHSTYNALQAEVRRRTRGGLDYQFNYTFAKVLSDSAGVSQSRLEHFLDLANPKLERARADFDITHVFKGNAIYELPWLKRGRWSRLGGWSVSGIMTWQSGPPFSVVSGRGTLNRASGSRSANNMANTTLDKAQLDDLFRLRMTGDGPYFVAASAIGRDGRAVASDREAPFAGQVFFHPEPGTVGGLQRRMFSGPWAFNLDFGIHKRTQITERHSIELRMEGTNILNHATFYVGDQNINSVSFGRIGDTFYEPRVIQFGMYYRF